MLRMVWTLMLVTLVFGLGPRAADLGWTQTARVFLIDAYAYPLAPKLEFDAEKLAQTMQDMHVNVVRFATMGKYCTIQGARFSTHPDQGKRDLLAEMIAACKPRGIRVVPYISTGHKLAWSMVTRDYPQYGQVSKPGGGPLKLRMFAGEEHGTVCWNTPYRQAFLDLVEHVVRDYDVDGIYFDTWRIAYFWKEPRVCYCDGCRNGFRKATGLELPYHEHLKDYTKAELETIDKYHKWYQDQLVSVLREVRRIVKKYKDIPLIYNINNPQSIAREDPRILENLDAFLYERGESMLKRAEGVSLARAAGFHVWPYIGGYDNWPRIVHNGLDYQQEVFTTAMFGGGTIVAQPTGFLVSKENANIISYPFSVLEKNEAYFRGFSNYPHVAVVYGFQDPPGHAQKTWFWDSNVRSSTLGAFAACLYRHIQVSSILDSVLDDPARLSRYKVLFLADIPHLSPQRIANIKAFVKNGGGLIATYDASLYDGKGHKQSRFDLEDLINVKPVEPTGELAHWMEYYSSKLGGPHDLYVLGRGTELGERWKDRLVPLFFYQPVEVLGEGKTEADIIRGGGGALLPAVVWSNCGKGRVAYLASSLGSFYAQSNAKIVGDFLETLVRKVASVEPPYEVSAPETLITNLATKGNEYVLHMTNWTGDKLEMPRADAYYIAPVENVRVRFRVPEGKKPAGVRLLVPGKFTSRNLGDEVEVILPRVEAYQGITFSLRSK